MFIGTHSFVRRRRNWIIKYRINQKNSLSSILSYDIRRVVPREMELNEHSGRSSIFTIALLFRLGSRRIDTFGTYSRATGALKDCVPRRVLLGSTTPAIFFRDVFSYYTDCNRISRKYDVYDDVYVINAIMIKKLNIKTYDNNLLNMYKM